MNIFKQSFVAIGLCAFLAACGGGGDAAPTPPPTPPVTDKYVGNWGTVCVAGPGGFFKSILVITKKSATVYTASARIDKFTTSNCSGAGTPVPGDSGTEEFMVVGSKAASGKTVDKITNPTGGEKDIAFADSTNLQFGNESSLDAEGFPVALDTTVTLTKQ